MKFREIMIFSVIGLAVAGCSSRGDFHVGQVHSAAAVGVVVHPTPVVPPAPVAQPRPLIVPKTVEQPIVVAPPLPAKKPSTYQKIKSSVKQEFKKLNDEVPGKKK